MGEIVHKKYGSRTYQNGDAERLVRLYNAVTGRSRTLEEYQWEWLNTPQGQGSIWVIQHQSDEEVVGHHGLIPIQFMLFGQPILVGKTENTMIHPEHQGRILYLVYEKKFLKEAGNRFDFLYTTTGGLPGRIRKKLGYTTVGPYATYVRVFQKAGLDKLVADIIKEVVGNKILAQLLIIGAKIFNYIFLLLFISRRSIDKAIQFKKLEKIDDHMVALDELWNKNQAEFGVTIKKDARYLKWRVFDNPNLNYDFFAGFKGDQIIGYAVIEYWDSGMALIVDLVADGNSDLLYDTLLQQLIEALKGNGVHSVMCPTLYSHNRFNKALQRNGFRSFYTILNQIYRMTGKEQPGLLIKTLHQNLDERLHDPEHWHFTSIFQEGVSRPYKIPEMVVNLIQKRQETTD